MLKTTALAGFMLAAVAATAGLRSYYPVQINLDYRTASGQFADVRATAGSDEYIECWGSTRPGSRWIQCMAADRRRSIVACWSDDPAIVAAVDALGTDSYLSFTWNPADGTCTNVDTYVGSRFTPKML